MESETFRLSSYLLDMECLPAAVPQQMLDDDGSSIWRKVTAINQKFHLLEDWYVSNGRKKRHTMMNVNGYAEGHYREWFEDGRLRVNSWYRNGRRQH